AGMLQANQSPTMLPDVQCGSRVAKKLVDVVVAEIRQRASRISGSLIDGWLFGERFCGFRLRLGGCRRRIKRRLAERRLFVDRRQLIVGRHGLVSLIAELAAET